MSVFVWVLSSSVGQQLCVAYYVIILTSLLILVSIDIFLNNNKNSSTRVLLLHGKQLSTDIKSSWHVPKSWFSHFYITAIFTTMLFHFALDSFNITLIAFLIHSTRRLIEQLFLFAPNNQNISLMHMGHYILGQTYYVVTSVTLGRNGARSNAKNLSISTTLFALAIFITSSVFQWRHHVILGMGRRSLEKDFTCRRGVPKGGVFHLIACPHYTGEICLYLGLVILCGWPLSVEMCLLLTWVVLNLGVSAQKAHDYYALQEQPPPYKLIPFVY